MKIRSKLLVSLLALVMVVSMTAMTGCGNNDTDENASWADRYAALLDSGEARDYEGYDDLKSELDSIRADCGATYVYVLTPAGDDETKPDISGVYDENGNFLITVDGSDDPDDWAVNYGWEIQFTEAWEGTPAAARSAWDDGDDTYCWSAFAPVYNSDGNVVCILGIDYPCSEVIKDHPEWNRDGDTWNGFEDEISGDYPEDVAEMRTTVTNYADKYAKQLSGNE